MVLRRVSDITHGDRPFHNPLDPARVDALVARLGLEADDRVVDLGCGPGELLVRIAERHGCAGVGVDLDGVLVAEGRRRAAERAPQVELIEGDAASAELPAASFALAACLGSSHALGGLEPAVRRLAELVRPGGYVLVADGFWRRTPPAVYLEALGASEDELGDLAGLVGAGEAAGLAPVAVLESTTADWDDYEWELIHNGERFAAEHPGDPVTPKVRERVAASRDRILGPGGRDVLGFALVAWLRPRAAAGT